MGFRKAKNFMPGRFGRNPEFRLYSLIIKSSFKFIHPGAYMLSQCIGRLVKFGVIVKTSNVTDYIGFAAGSFYSDPKFLTPNLLYKWGCPEPTGLPRAGRSGFPSY